MSEAMGKSYTPPPAVESARAAGLRYVTDRTPGIARRAASRTFRYLSPGGARVRDRATLHRIRALAIPPAWTDVWICPRGDGHIQATGRDARGRSLRSSHDEIRFLGSVFESVLQNRD